ncbi:MAG: hypothetical protein ACK587_07510 [Cyanobacteriota bacterium]
MSFSSNISNTSLTILGYCDQEEESIKMLIQNKEYSRIQNMGGEYTLIYETPDMTVIITSMIGAIQYFYYFDGKKFAHGSQIIDIVISSNLEWSWDWESLGDLCELENLTKNRTLHREIKKVPAGTVLIYDNDLIVRTSNLLDTIKLDKADPVDAVNILNQETKKLAGKDPILSLSGGFDSRVILSSLLKQGIYPTVVTLGGETNSDMKVADMIASKFSLTHIKIRLSLEDIIESGEKISSLTNGSKPACHWHTYLYPKKADLAKERTFFVGTLGEFARSYYFDKGFISLLNDSFAKFAQTKFWLLKLSRHRTFLKEEYPYICEDLNKEIGREGIQRRAERNALLSSGDFLSGGTRYYLEQRVPHFYANGISMYNASSSWRSPFHSRKWLETIWNLCDQWKLGSNWHRLAISRNYPKLLQFPEEKGFHRKRMLTKAPPLYWLPIMQREKYNTYDMSAEWYTSKLIREFILDNTSCIDEFISRSLCESILEQHLVTKGRTRAISFILTILYFKLALSRGKS